MSARLIYSPYEEHRKYVLSVLGRRCAWLDASDREGLLHDAYTVLLEKQREGTLQLSEMRPAQIRAYLTQTALNKALDEGKRAGRRRSVPLLDDAYESFAPSPAHDELVAARMEGARVREIVAELPERQQQIVSLRFFFDWTPRQIGRYLGVTERVYRRELERGLRHIGERFELVRNGTFCESRESLIRAYVAGIAGPNRSAEARRHLQTCQGCARWAGQLR
jgi:RNA polymerase sigma factor (sigma-70 family)